MSLAIFPRRFTVFIFTEVTRPGPVPFRKPKVRLGLLEMIQVSGGINHL